jgi:replication-associated recombination protein RarA
MPTFATMHTPGGYFCGEVSSALQKSIRRGLERESLFWASELDLAGYGNYVWKRLRIIASEDVGPADPVVPVLIRTLYENWLEQRKADNGDSLNNALFLVHAVIVLARAKKRRVVDHALMAFYEADRREIAIDVPDFALDQHTDAGRRMGRGLDHFFEEGSHLENVAEDVPDPYGKKPTWPTSEKVEQTRREREQTPQQRGRRRARVGA